MTISALGRRGPLRLYQGIVAAALWVSMVLACEAGEAKIAVAANFTEPARDIAAQFEMVTGHKAILSFGATGQFYAQIAHGAPFEVLLAADKATPAKAVGEGHAMAGTTFTYAVGKLVLYSKIEGLVTDGGTLRDGKFTKLAIANPQTAPYGAAAVETMKALEVFDLLRPKIVQGNNIAQTYQFIETGNAEAGFVALAQVALIKGGSRWVVPPDLHAAIAQDAVLLKAGEKSEPAGAFLTFLKGPQARAVIETYGYGLSK